MNVLRKSIITAAFLAFAQAGLYAQFAVTAPVLESLMQWTHLDQVIYYAQAIEQQVQAATTAYNQFQNMVRAEQRALENLQGLGKIRNFDDFMSWYNRQLYLERQAESRFTNMGVKIGNTNYKLKDIDKIPDAANSQYVEYWNNEFTPEQRRDMWYNLGMTPTNYAYVQTWKAKEDEIGQILLGNSGIIDEENNAAEEQNKALYDQVMNEDVGEKGVLQAIFQVLVDNNRAIRQSNADRARKDAYDLAKDKQQELPGNKPDEPLLSDWWGKSYYRPIDDD
jgi:hypothetical protein